MKRKEIMEAIMGSCYGLLYCLLMVAIFNGPKWATAMIATFMFVSSMILIWITDKLK